LHAHAFIAEDSLIRRFVMIHVLIVDDHVSLREALAFLIGQEPDITVNAQAGSLAQARLAIASDAVDVALIDLDLPDGQGLVLLPDLHARHPEAAAVILTGSTRPESQALAIAAGAVGFLHKSTNVQEIVDAIRHLASGQSLLTPAQAIALMRQAAQYEDRVRVAAKTLGQLTPREKDVLRALADGLDNQAIADRLSLSTATVRSHVVQVLRKLDVNSRLQAALIAVRHGFATPDGRDETP
jgi:DNA-binding NarL/FixJ family response regulator